MAVPSLSLADVYINVMAVNGTSEERETSVNFNLPGDLTSEDILDTSGLELDYNVNDANYYVHGKVKLAAKESKTFRIRVRDIWKMTPQQIDDIKNEIDQGYEKIGKIKDPQQGELLKDSLIQKLDFISQEEGTKADSVEKRIDAYRAYSKQLKRIEDNALAVDYWRSDPSVVNQDKIIHFNITVDNPFDVAKPYKHKHYMPAEIRPQDLVEFEGFEIRYDQDKKQVFLFREDQLQPKEKKSYVIGLRDIWFVPQKDIDYLRTRSSYAYDILKDSKFLSMAKFLFEHVQELIKGIEDSQAQKRDNIADHISAFRENQRAYENARTDVESLEKLLAVFREDLEKSKVGNVLQKIHSLKGIGDISKAVFNKNTPTEGTTWIYIGWILLFVGLITIANFVVWFIRSKKSEVPSEKKTP